MPALVSVSMQLYFVIVCPSQLGPPWAGHHQEPRYGSTGNMPVSTLSGNLQRLGGNGEQIAEIVVIDLQHGFNRYPIPVGNIDNLSAALPMKRNGGNARLAFARWQCDVCPDRASAPIGQRDGIAQGEPARVFDPLARLLVVVEGPARAAHGDLLCARALFASDANPHFARQWAVNRGTSRFESRVTVLAFHKSINFPSHVLPSQLNV